jgi:hypothetical protein
LLGPFDFFTSLLDLPEFLELINSQGPKRTRGFSAFTHWSPHCIASLDWLESEFLLSAAHVLTRSFGWTGEAIVMVPLLELINHCHPREVKFEYIYGHAKRKHWSCVCCLFDFVLLSVASLF